jgi:predicted PhzF superfamily epimerase YddE/YHI9
MLKIAGEMNLSETAFVKVLAEGESHSTASNFGLRWFTPTTEVPLCGHATLASSGVLFQAVGKTTHPPRCARPQSLSVSGPFQPPSAFDIGNKSPSITFQTLSGELRVARDIDNLISMGKTAVSRCCFRVMIRWQLLYLELPRTTCMEVTDDVFSLTVAIASNGLPVHSVHLSTGTKKLLVRLSDDVSR